MLCFNHCHWFTTSTFNKRWPIQLLVNSATRPNHLKVSLTIHTLCYSTSIDSDGDTFILPINQFNTKTIQLSLMQNHTTMFWNEVL